MMPPALVLSSGAAGLAVVRGLGERKVPVVVVHWDEGDLGAASRHTVGTVLVPEPERRDDAFVEALLALAERFSNAVVVPTSDDAVKDVARRRDDLSRHYSVACPPWSVVERFVDKRHTYAIAERAGVAIPRTLVPERLEDLDAFDAEVEYPCLVKPRESHLYSAAFGRKMTTVHSLAEMREAFGAASAAGLTVLVQELIPGPDTNGVTHNAYRADGRILAECTARKVRLAPPRFGRPRVALSTAVAGVIAPARALLEALGHEGMACTEFKLDPRDGTFKLMEVNGRHNHSGMLAIRAGVNFPWIEYRHRTTGEHPGALRAEDGLYWIHEAHDLQHSLRRAGRDGASVRELARPWARRHTFAITDRSDPGPTWKAALRVLTRVDGAAG